MDSRWPGVPAPPIQASMGQTAAVRQGTCVRLCCVKLKYKRTFFLTFDVVLLNLLNKKIKQSRNLLY
jgi:hypothetical protein